MKAKELLKFIFAVIFVTIFGLSITFIDSVKVAVIESLKTTVFTIVPSLFVSSTLSSVICKSGIIEVVFKKSKISPYCITAFIIGNLGGYPVGAKTISDMLKSGKISIAEAENAMKYSFSPGPAFILGVVSLNLFKSSILGYICFASILISNTIIFVLDKNKYSTNKSTAKIDVSTKEILTSVRGSADAMLTVGSTIVFFSAIKEIIYHILPVLKSIPVISVLLEISNILEIDFRGSVSFAAITALLSFGGSCIHMQLLSLVEGQFSFKGFYKIRLIQISIATVISYIGYIITNWCFPAACVAPVYKITQNTSIIPFICVAFMMLIAFTHKERHTN